MRANTPMSLILGLLLALVPACGSDGSDEDDTGATSSTDDAGGTTVDSGLLPPDVLPPDPPPAGQETFEIGTNVPGKTTPLAFTPATEQATVEVVLGSQGAWMVVIAARTDGFPAETKRVNVVASITPPGGEVYGKLKFKKRPIINGNDGYRYLMNVFLVVSNDLSWDGQQAELALALEDELGNSFEDTVTVTLHKGGTADVSDP